MGGVGCKPLSSHQTGRVTRALPLAALVLLGGAAACSSPADPGAPMHGAQTSGTAESGGSTAEVDEGTGAWTGGSESGASPDAGSPGRVPPAGHASEDFEGPNGDPWPAPWIALGGVADHALEDGRGRLIGVPLTVARMAMTGIDVLDFDAEITVELTARSGQGFGMYVRQNGGRLRDTDPPGQGYAVILEAGAPPHLGVWRERAGVEELVGGGAMMRPIEPRVPHRVRLQCIQLENATLLRTKIWRANEPEPDTWAVELIDVTPELQDVTGDIALDVYDHEGGGSVYVDDFVLRPPS
jgi:hypothetical protein